MIKLIKDFLIFKGFINSFQTIDLTDEDKVKLEAFDKDLLRKVINLSLDNLIKELLKDDLKRDYILGYKYGLYHLLSYFRKYNK